MTWLGAHLSIAKGYAHAAETCQTIGGNVFQFFSRNPRGGSVKALNEADIAAFQQLRRAHCFGPLLAHAPYTVNPASAEAKTADFARTALQEDLRRMDALGIEYFNLHPGSHVGQGLAAGIERSRECLNRVLDGDEGQILLLLETMAGQGSEIGFRFEQLRQIIDGLEQRQRLGVCLDLCHIFAAGYDIVSQLEAVLAEFDRSIGLERLKAIHLNDSMQPLAAQKDRHAVIGGGEIGLEAILHIMRHPQLCDLPFYLETPLDDEGHRREIAMLRKQLPLG